MNAKQSLMSLLQVRANEKKAESDKIRRIKGWKDIC